MTWSNVFTQENGVLLSASLQSVKLLAKHFLVKDAMKDLQTNLRTNKSTISGDISTSILRQHAQIYSKKLADMFNESTKTGKFPDIPKKAEINPVY